MGSSSSATQAESDANPSDAITLLPNAQQPFPHILTGGQPSLEQLDGIAEAGYQTIVNLRSPNEEGNTRRQDVEARGLRYLEIPVAGSNGLSEENARALAEVMADPDLYPLVIHCRSGNRVGALLALKAYWLDGADASEALGLGLRGGLTSLEPVVREKLGLPPVEEAVGSQSP